MKRIATATAVGAITVLACATPAAQGSKGSSGAGHKLKAAPEATATAASTAAGNGAIATATATCPKGMHVVGGGFDAPSSVEVLGLVYESVRAGPRSWRASAQLLDMGSTTGLTLKTSAYCRARIAPAKTRRTTTSTDGTPHLGPEVPATCRRSQVAVAGGFTMQPPLVGQAVTALVLDSRRSGVSAWNSWLATGAGGTGSATTEVYCARGPLGISEQIATTPLSPTYFEDMTATARCRPDKRPISGGFSQPQSDVNSFIFIYESQRAGDGWRVSGLHAGTDPAVSLSALAYCV